MPTWTPQLSIDESLVRELVGAQFPELELASVRFLAAGWDCAVWAVDERWGFRFLQRAVVAPCVERELEVLPRLAPRLPLPIPTPRFRGRPTDQFPWPFFGAALIPGREATDAAPDRQARMSIASSLGEFLSALHDPSVLEAVGASCALPGDANARADMAALVPRTRERLAEVERIGLWHAPAWIEDLFAQASRLPESQPNAVAHGDLHFRQLLVDDHALTGVIDWIDVCHADRSIDLQLVWSFLGPAARGRFFDAYGPVSGEELLRARVLALYLCGTLAAYGDHEGLPRVRREALDGLDRTVIE